MWVWSWLFLKNHIALSGMMWTVERVLLCRGRLSPSLSVTMLLEWKQVSHLMFSRLSLTFYIYLFICFTSALGPLKLSCSSHRCSLLTAHRMSGEKLDVWRMDTHIVAGINLLRRSPSQIDKIVCMQVFTVDMKVGKRIGLGLKMIKKKMK